MIRYKLKKDLPDAKVGTILTKEDKPNGLYMYCGKFDGTDPSSWYAEEAIESAPDWFELIKEEPKEVFTWDDEKAKEFYTFCYNNVFKQPTYPEEMIERFKQSKASTTVNLTLNDSHRVTNTSKERIDRIEVTDVIAAGCSDNGNWYRFHIARSPGKPWPEIPKVNFPLIKRAIEDTLNGIPTPPFINYSLDHKFTQQDLDKAREQTWKACRETTGQPIGRGEYNEGDCGDLYRNKYPTLESYLNHISKTTKE